MECVDAIWVVGSCLLPQGPHTVKVHVKTVWEPLQSHIPRVPQLIRQLVGKGFSVQKRGRH